MRKKPKMIKLEPKQLHQLVQSPNWRRDETHYQLIMDANQDKTRKTFEAVYINEQVDEVLLEYEYGWGFLFSTESFERFVNKLRRPLPSGPQHILAGLFPYGADFPDHVNDLIQQLPRLMQLPPDDLDFSFDSLKSFDRVLQESDLEEALEPHLFPALVAYCGEVLRRTGGGYWDMWHSQQFPDIWEPWVQPLQGPPIYIGDVVRRVLEEDYPVSLEGRIRAVYEEWYLRSRNRRE